MLFLASAWFLLALTAEAGCARSYTNYTSVGGYFLQDDPSTNASTFSYIDTNFGLINRTYSMDPLEGSQSQWEQFYLEVQRLNREAPKNIDYKVLFIGRHGEGYHNAAEDYYGTPAWNCYWAELNGNATNTWNDALLDSNGVVQALEANALWAKLINTQKIHTPDAFFVSPLSRCLQTVNLTFSTLNLDNFVPTIKENFRESISIHTCDQRRNKTYIHNLVPSYHIEAGFTEHDELWNGVAAETNSAQDVRSRKALDDVLETEHGLFISITTHSGEAASLLRVLNHQVFSLATGAVIPVLVKAEKIVPTPTTSTQPWTASAHCTAPPLSSVTNGGACICPNSAAPVTTPLVPTTPP
ncbi:phosphoglycerate mutase-like protein [Xylariaceae sp. FL0255]|nr:phosphoglycerate mutase-like protein [Xylariaceae sp. FL0255]